MAEPQQSQAAPVTKTAGGNAAYHNFHNDFAHVQDSNERRRLALAEIDKAPFGWYHVRAVLVAGVGFFTDSYDIFCVSLLTTMLGIVYYPGVGKMPTHSDTAIKLATSAGTVFGQFGFGLMADIVSTIPLTVLDHVAAQQKLHCFCSFINTLLCRLAVRRCMVWSCWSLSSRLLLRLSPAALPPWISLVS